MTVRQTHSGLARRFISGNGHSNSSRGIYGGNSTWDWDFAWPDVIDAMGKMRGRVAADKQLANHDFRGSAYSFEELVELRSEEHLAEQITPERWQERSAACEAALEILAAKYSEVAPDVAVINANFF